LAEERRPALRLDARRFFADFLGLRFAMVADCTLNVRGVNFVDTQVFSWVGSPCGLV
jgi:hypothetical protein